MRAREGPRTREAGILRVARHGLLAWWEPEGSAQWGSTGAQGSVHAGLGREPCTGMALLDACSGRYLTRPRAVRLLDGRTGTIGPWYKLLFKEVTWGNGVPTPAPAKLLALHTRGKPRPGTLGRAQDSRNSLSKDGTRGRGRLEPECSTSSQCPLRAAVSLPCRVALPRTQRDLQASSDGGDDPGSHHPAVA